MMKNMSGKLVCMSAAAALSLGSACSGGDGACSPESGTICTIIGSGLAGLNGDGLDALETDIYLPQDVTEGPDQRLYFTDWNNHRIRVLADDGAIETVAGTGMLGDGPEGPALEADFNHPTQVVFDPTGAMVIAAWHNSRLKRMNLSTGLLEDICGTGARAYAGDGGPAEAAILDLPASVVFDQSGNTIIMDQANQVIRRVNPSGTIETIAGQCLVNECAAGEVPVACEGSNKMGCGVETDAELCKQPCIPAYGGDNGPGTEMRMAQPFGQAADPAGRMVLDSQGNLYFADTRNHRIRRIDTEGIVTTVAGKGTDGYAGDGGPAVDAQLSSPTDIDLASDGTLYIADTQNSCVRAVSPEGTITTAAGICGQRGFEGDGAAPTAALLDRPYGIELDRDDNLYVVDTYNHRIRVVMQ
jgi:DNA-binding beta-propeller fold protein YncE